jgi:hypothetical protein
VQYNTWIFDICPAQKELAHRGFLDEDRLFTTRFPIYFVCQLFEHLQCGGLVAADSVPAEKAASETELTSRMPEICGS